VNYLSHYISQKKTDLFNKTGAFFAFSDKQFNEQKIYNVVYTHCGSGLTAPVNNVKKVMEGLKSIYAAGIAEDISENGKDAIIQRELGNHEAQITGDISDTVDALDGYGITAAEVKAGYSVFFQTCIDNDWF